MRDSHTCHEHSACVLCASSGYDPRGVSSVRSVLIVGGGIAGMSLAVALRDSDIRTEIVESTPEWTALGIGIALTAPSCRALKRLGVLEQCIDVGFSVTRVGQIATDSYEVSYVGEASRLLGPEYPSSLGIMRPAFHQILAGASRAAGAAIRLGLTVQSMDQSSDNVMVTFTDGSQGTYDLVVGADGIGSRVRELVWGPEVEPRFTGQSVWRNTVPRPPEVEAIVSVQGGPNANVGFNPVSRDLMYIFIVQNTPEKERLPVERLPELARAQLAGYGGLVARAREQITDPSQVLMRPIEAILVPPPWHTDRVLLIGDAAHATTPHMASGACIAIEDAVVLGELLRGDAPLPEVLTTFMERRYERCRMVVENSIQLGEWQKHPDSLSADPARLARESQALLAQPIW
jgi:2-polyprenyl-6-methoxyphenol hydroxylase-like FAD-dependent oxidoreductase